MPVPPAGTPLDATPDVAPGVRARFAVGHQEAFAALWNANSRLFRSIADEAMRDEPENARKMFRDLQIRSLIVERLLPSTALRFSVEADNPKDEDQSHFAGKYDKILAATPRIADLKTHLGMSLFFGKYGSQLAKARRPVDGRSAVVVVDHMPWSGDKINWDWDGVPAVLVRTSFRADNARFEPLRGGAKIPPPEFRASDRMGGKYLMLDRPFWRDRWAIQSACPVDRDFLTEGDLAGQVHGEGLRSLLYWTWYMREQLKAWALDAVQRMGVNGMLYAYCDSGNPADERAILDALANLVLNNIAVFKRVGGVQEQGINSIPPSPILLEGLRSLIDYFDGQIKLAVVGQELSSGTEPTGMGSSVAEFHRTTKEALVRADVERLDETLTTDLLRMLQRDNGDDDLPFQFRIRSRLDDQDGLESLQKAQLAQAIGLELDEEDVRDKSGFKKPEDPEHALRPAAVSMPGMPGDGGKPAGPGTPHPPTLLKDYERDAIGRRIGKRAHQAASYAKDHADPDDPGVMIALYPPEDVAESLAIPGGEEADDLHCTLCYLGRVSEVGRERIPALESALRSATSGRIPLTGSIGGMGRFPSSVSSDGMGVLYAGVDVPGLVELRQAICGAVESAGFDYRKEHGFTPHVTLDYIEPSEPVAIGEQRSHRGAFHVAWLVIGDRRVPFPLGDPDGAPGHHQRADYAAEHAPHKMTVDGREYRGGEFLPGPKDRKPSVADTAPHHRKVAYRTSARVARDHPDRALSLDEGDEPTRREARVLTEWKVAGEPASLVVHDPHRGHALARSEDHDEDDVAEANANPYSVLSPFGEGHDLHGHHPTRADAEAQAREVAGDARAQHADEGAELVPAGASIRDHLPDFDHAHHEVRLRERRPSPGELRDLMEQDRDDWLAGHSRAEFPSKDAYLAAMKAHVSGRARPAPAADPGAAP